MSGTNNNRFAPLSAESSPSQASNSPPDTDERGVHHVTVDGQSTIFHQPSTTTSDESPASGNTAFRIDTDSQLREISTALLVKRWAVVPTYHISPTGVHTVYSKRLLSCEEYLSRLVSTGMLSLMPSIDLDLLRPYIANVWSYLQVDSWDMLGKYCLPPNTLVQRAMESAMDGFIRLQLIDALDDNYPHSEGTQAVSIFAMLLATTVITLVEVSQSLHELPAHRSRKSLPKIVPLLDGGIVRYLDTAALAASTIEIWDGHIPNLFDIACPVHVHPTWDKHVRGHDDIQSTPDGSVVEPKEGPPLDPIRKAHGVDYTAGTTPTVDPGPQMAPPPVKDTPSTVPTVVIDNSTAHTKIPEDTDTSLVGEIFQNATTFLGDPLVPMDASESALGSLIFPTFPR